jgi:hypothetical protein
LTERVVGEVDSDRMIPDANHAGSYLRLGILDQLHDLGAADFFNLNCFQFVTPTQILRSFLFCSIRAAAPLSEMLGAAFLTCQVGTKFSQSSTSRRTFYCFPRTCAQNARAFGEISD